MVDHVVLVGTYAAHINRSIMCFPWLRLGLLVGSAGRHCRSCWKILLEQIVWKMVGIGARTIKGYRSLTLNEWYALAA